ncbi:MAG: FAD-dependent oxidoreductase [Zoogloeaceae bacterium]|nr:FAD-dependent oxidoreductase [Zoogloeaceae bacterium]MCP5239241.1 FAD-dependent oxidoreductase [Zoogloeaceae bacterium]MCP5255827.1 FAD-dependent oxidoreductase [Zoogloeaceae bacterium]MCP5295803.1 FAD-dependent oxidoreductase [Zoogloeaceae bacterium]MCW5615472.1 FAD-dependent oxidoreductase [Rhodocyclaceae bacterium]
MSKPNICILGAGFAALTAVRELRKRSADVRITLIAPRPEFIYLPSLIWIPTGLRKGDDLRVALEPFFSRHAVDYVRASVTGVSDGGRRVHTDSGEYRNDALLIASGGRFIKKLPGIEHAITLCEGIPAAERIRERILAMDRGRIALGFGGNPNEPSAMRGGPMFELLFGLERWLRRQKRRDRIELTFFNAAAEPGRRLGEGAVKSLLAEMGRRRIDTHLGHKPLRFSESGVDTDAGHIEADLILFMPGLTGPAWLGDSELPASPGGFVKADEHCSVEACERVFVAGDAGSYPGPDWLPKQAHMADLQARAAAQNLLATLAGQAPRATPKPELICIVDSYDAGMLVYRSPRRSFMLPSSRVLHWSKRYFESHYLKAIR